jgi:hypothetical protein
VGFECSSFIELVEGSNALTGNYTADPVTAGSCDTTPTNTVWVSFTPAESATYEIGAVNNWVTTGWSDAYSRLAIFGPDSCGDLAANELSCETTTNQEINASAYLEAGMTYTIAFYTDGDTYDMEDPGFTVTNLPPTPCEIYCGLAAENCTDAFTIDFADATCMEACMMWPAGEEGDTSGNSVACRAYHADDPAALDPATHCPHASPDGGGVCGCAPGTESVAITMSDSYGDGWNGNEIVIGDQTATIEDGDEGTASFCLDLSICNAYTVGGGSYPSEISWTIGDISGSGEGEGTIGTCTE